MVYRAGHATIFRFAAKTRRQRVRASVLMPRCLNKVIFCLKTWSCCRECTQLWIVLEVVQKVNYNCYRYQGNMSSLLYWGKFMIECVHNCVYDTSLFGGFMSYALYVCIVFLHNYYLAVFAVHGWLSNMQQQNTNQHIKLIYDVNKSQKSKHVNFLW